jgi:hypothetical protein
MLGCLFCEIRLNQTDCLKVGIIGTFNKIYTGVKNKSSQIFAISQLVFFHILAPVILECYAT